MANKNKAKGFTWERNVRDFFPKIGFVKAERATFTGGADHGDLINLPRLAVECRTREDIDFAKGAHYDALDNVHAIVNQEMGMKVIIVDDHAVSIAGAKALLDSSLAEGSEVKGCPDSNLALSEILTWEPDVVVCDLNFGPGESGGFTLADNAWEAGSSSKFLMYTGADTHIAALVGDIKGLVGKNIFSIQSKSGDGDALTKAVEKVADGIRSYDAFTVREAKKKLDDQQVDIIETFSKLTPRQMELVQAYATEPDRKSVAKALSISDSTVKNSISRLLLEFGYDNMRLVVAKYQEYLKVLEDLGQSL
jgi:DNA-binding NarL/FixJ family response regulator